MRSPGCRDQVEYFGVLGPESYSFFRYAITNDNDWRYHQIKHLHCVTSVRIRSYSGQCFPAFGLNTYRYSASLRIQSDFGKIRTKITPNTDNFYAVLIALVFKDQCKLLWISPLLIPEIFMKSFQKGSFKICDT